MRVLALVVCGVLIEGGWLALWPLSGALSHSARFTAALLDMHPLVDRLFTLSVHGARRLLPDLPESPLTDPLGSPAYIVPAIALGVVMLWLAASYLLALLVLDHRAGALRRATWIIVGGAIAFQATVLWLPGLFSQDVFSYIAYGRIAAIYDLNPYVWPPSVLRDPVVSWVADIWRDYAAPYGPLWVSVQWLVARLTGNLPIADQALVYRLLANVLLLVNLGLLWRLLGRVVPLSLTQRTTALAALAWNPLVIFEFAGNAHNDVLMITFSLLGLQLFRPASRGLLSSLAFSLGALVKYLSGLGLLWLAIASTARVRSNLRRARRIIAIALIAAATAFVMAVPWLELPDSLEPLVNETAGVGYVNSLPDMLVLWLANRSGVGVDPARSAERVIVWACFALYLVWEARRVWSDPNRAGVARALGRSSLIYVVFVSTSVQTWYLCLPVAIAVTLGWRRRACQLALAYSALALPALYLSYYLREATPGWVFVVYGLAPLLVLIPGLGTRGRRERLPLNHDERRLLVRSDVPVGMDHLALDARSRPDARPERALARDEPGGAE